MYNKNTYLPENTLMKKRNTYSTIKFKGPIEETVFKNCPSRSYCSVDKCFRSGTGCIADDSCCLNKEKITDLLNDLGCPAEINSNRFNLSLPQCQTIQQYCDLISPQLLTDPDIKKMCCEIDLQSGVKVRNVCGCDGDPCGPSSDKTIKSSGVNAFESTSKKEDKTNIFLIIFIFFILFSFLFLFFYNK
jgi:hypothetical protein